MQIPTGTIATIQFTPLDSDGDPAQLDGVLSFSLAPGSEAFATLLGSPGDNQIDLRGDAAGEVQVIATGDVLLGSGTESVVWTCSFVIYDRADHLTCEIISSRPVADE